MVFWVVPDPQKMSNFGRRVPPAEKIQGVPFIIPNNEKVRPEIGTPEF